MMNNRYVLALAYLAVPLGLLAALVGLLSLWPEIVLVSLLVGGAFISLGVLALNLADLDIEERAAEKRQRERQP